MSQTVATRSILEVVSLSKTFPGQVALDDASLVVLPGQVHALVGQNGSGKSTLIKVLAGYHDPDPGSHVQVLGRDLFAEHETDLRRRIHVMHQDLGLVGSLNAVENLALGRGFHTGRFGRVRWKAETARARAILHEFGATFDPRLPVASLTAAEQAILALARAMQDWDGDGGLLVLDEPTASFSRDDVDRLFGAVRRVADRGAGVIFVSHRLDEVFEISDQVTVLRDGRVVACRPTREMDHDALVELIVGRAVDEMYPAPPPTGTKVVLEVRGLWGDIVEQVDLVVHSGEIVGIAGLDGSGREELAGLLFGARHRSHGQVIVEGEELAASPRSAMEHGVALVPADRKRMGSIGNQSVRQNITIAQLGPLFRGGRLSRRLEQREARRWIAEVEVRPDDPERIFETLSGGNQQKAVLARWLRTKPKLLLLDEPTQGVDVGAKATIYGLLAGAAASGTAIVVCSSEADELAKICDRVLVLRHGRVGAELKGSELATETVLQHVLQ